MKAKTKILLTCLLGSFFLSHVAAAAEKETRYLSFQIFTHYTSDPEDAQAMSNGMRERLTPGTAALRNYVADIKQRIGTVGNPQTRLAVMLGPLCFDQTDTEITQFVENAFKLALEADVAVGFHIDDSMFWRSRQDLWSDPKNVEALDWDGTPCMSRRLDWSKNPTEAPPQMCFNSQVIQREVQQRAAVIGKAIQAGVNRLQQLKRPELFAGVIVGWETMIGQDFKTGKYLGYRALLNRGFSRERPPQDINVELESIVQEFIERWTTGIAGAGVSPQKIYSHTAFLSRRAFNMGDSKEITYMQKSKDAAYSQHNHFAPPWVAFGKHHRPGFSTYPQPGLFEDIYELVNKHQQAGWASSEGTNMQPGTGPGQTGMSMETYLAKMFNHGATLTTIFSWGIGGEAMKNMNYRVCTENEEALQAYRKCLKGEPLIEGATVAGLQERLPPKIQKIQKELPSWMQKTGNTEAAALMQKMQGQMKAKDWLEVEKTVDSILKMMGASAPSSSQSAESKPPQTPPSSPPSDDPTRRLTEKVERIKEGAQKWAASGRDPSVIAKTMEEKFKPLIETGKVIEAEAELDRVLKQLTKDGKSTESPTSATESVNQRDAATGGRIAFPGRDAQGRQQLFTIRIDGTERRQLTFENNNSMPNWSPDGARLVCVSRTPAPNLTILDEDGGNQRTLVTGDAPDWGPNGQIAYTSADQTGHTVPTPGDPPAEIWVVDAKGGTRRQVTSGGNHGGRVHPSWSPDGKRLVFMQLTPQDSATDDTANGCPALPVRAELWTIDADGTHARLLTTTGFSNFNTSGQFINSASDANAPDWSPAGDVITFWSGQEQCYGQVWRINADGSGRTQLTKAPIPSHNDDPAWSPDGRQVLFTTDRNGRPETWVMDADGSNPRFVTASKPGPGPGDAAWQPIRR